MDNWIVHKELWVIYGRVKDKHRGWVGANQSYGSLLAALASYISLWGHHEELALVLVHTQQLRLTPPQDRRKNTREKHIVLLRHNGKGWWE